MQIHQVVESDHLRHEIDPRQGAITRVEKVLKPGASVSIAGGDHGTFDIGPDGTFDVPDELAEFLLAQPGWYPGPNPLAEVVEEKPASKPRSAKAAS